ncbi:MAG TPA: hypothetical protein VI794_03175 [Patescibacteria group bacterium]|nr:hypothetical protein [Patescibacteria group bacterium]
MENACDIALVCTVGAGLRIGIPILVFVVLGLILHRITRNRNGDPK